MERVAAQYADMIYRIALNDTHSPADAEDILQDVLLARFAHKPLFEGSEHEKRWLIRVTLNKGKNLRRTLGRHPTVPLAQADGYPAAPQAYQALREAVADLPRLWRRTVDLYYYEGYSTPEIAAILHAKEPTVRTWLRRARLALKERLKEDWDYDES